VHIRSLQLHQQADKFAPARETRNQSPKTGAAENKHSRLQGGGSPPRWPVKRHANVKTVQKCSQCPKSVDRIARQRHVRVNKIQAITPRICDRRRQNDFQDDKKPNHQGRRRLTLPGPEQLMLARVSLLHRNTENKHEQRSGDSQRQEHAAQTARQKLRNEPRHALDCCLLCDGHHSRELFHLRQS